jgi:hypothetical protein
LPNAQDLATKDLQEIINTEGSPVTLINSERECQLKGLYSDIGSLINPITGEPVQGRSIEMAIPVGETMTKIGKPARGWKVRITHNGEEITLYIQRNEYDRTVELYRLTLGLELGELENE